MKRVAVLGGGPAGAMAAERLSASGLKTVLLDEKLAWEKPCGGGITWKAYTQYPFLLENETPKRVVHETKLAAPGAGDVKMSLSRPMLIYSRFDLNQMLLDRAARAGVQVEKERVNGVERNGPGWKLKTRHGAIDADYCVVATGARNPFRALGTDWTAADTMYALGYYIPQTQEHIDIQFLPGLVGYIWVFPRCGHLSAGICGKGQPASVLRRKLERFLHERGISLSGAEFYGHMLPALERLSWRRNRVSGERWMAVGDAAGLVDPVTGEGLYYAIRSGDLASQVVLNDLHDHASKPEAYRNLLRRDFATDLEYGALFAKRIFLERILFSSVPVRIIEFMRRSPRFNEIMQDLFSGSQPYLDLKHRLLRNLNGTLHEIIMSFFLGKLLPGEFHP